MVVVFAAGFYGLMTSTDWNLGGHLQGYENLAQAFWGTLLVAGVGLVDDFRHLSVKIRTTLYLLASIWCVYAIGFPVLDLPALQLDLGWVGLLGGTIYLTALLNLYNFMDGIDGLAAAEAVFVILGASLLAFINSTESMPVPVLLAAACGGFLVINWPRARLFMGDTGSGFLGIWLGIFSLFYTDISLWSWLILLAWFLSDSGLTLFMRWVNGEKIHEAHNLHAYQYMTRRLGGERTLCIILTTNIFWLFPFAFLANSYREWGIILLLLASLPLTVYQYRQGAGQRVLSRKQATRIKNG